MEEYGNTKGVKYLREQGALPWSQGEFQKAIEIIKYPLLLIDAPDRWINP